MNLNTFQRMQTRMNNDRDSQAMSRIQAAIHRAGGRMEQSELDRIAACNRAVIRHRMEQIDHAVPNDQIPHQSHHGPFRFLPRDAVDDRRVQRVGGGVLVVFQRLI